MAAGNCQLIIRCGSPSGCSSSLFIVSLAQQAARLHCARLYRFQFFRFQGPMKICFVSGFPPSKIVLNEYGYHVARELQADPLVSLTILADEYEGTEPELPEFDVERCWKVNRLSNHARLLRAIRNCKPDVVWFNLVFSSFGNKEHPLAAFSGLTLPA